MTLIHCLTNLPVAEAVATPALHSWLSYKLLLFLITSMVKRVKDDPEDQEAVIVVIPAKKYQRFCCPGECKNAGKRKSRCAEHGGIDLCPPAGCKNSGKQKANCAEHGGSKLCPAGCKNSGKQKANCAEHGGSKLCPAGCPAKYKARCAEHGGSELCPAGCVNARKAKKYCAEHGGSALCPGDCSAKFKVVCAKHGGSMLCVGCKMTKVQKSGGSCRTCVPVASFQSRVREARMAATINKWKSDGRIIAEVTWCNKQNPTAEPLQCGSYRNDFVYLWDEGVLVLEFDEEMHRGYPKRCELERMVRVTLGHGGLPVFWIRFNPDKFKVGGTTLTTSRKKREEVLLTMLKDTIGYADYDHFMTICYLFYDKPENTQEEDNYVQKFQFKTTQEYLEWIDSVAVPEDVVVVAAD
jgi:hypothetical protein